MTKIVFLGPTLSLERARSILQRQVIYRLRNAVTLCGFYKIGQAVLP